MLRNIVRIDSGKCNGCGACAEACVEGAIKMIDGKAVLVSEAYCDGLGACPAGAITIEVRETVPFAEPPSDKKEIPVPNSIPMASCSGSGPRRIAHEKDGFSPGNVPGRLSQWPVQLREWGPLLPINHSRDVASL